MRFQCSVLPNYLDNPLPGIRASVCQGPGTNWSLDLGFHELIKGTRIVTSNWVWDFLGHSCPLLKEAATEPGSSSSNRVPSLFLMLALNPQNCISNTSFLHVRFGVFFVATHRKVLQKFFPKNSRNNDAKMPRETWELQQRHNPRAAHGLQLRQSSLPCDLPERGCENV